MKLFANQQRRARPGTRRTQPVTRPRGLRRRTKVLLGAAALVTGVAAFAAYLYVHYVDVVRYSAAQGRCRIRAAAASSPITDGRYIPTSAMPLPVMRPARARTTTAGTGT